MSDSSSTSGSFIPATSVPDDIPRFRPLFHDDPSYPGDQPPAISIAIPSDPPNRPSNLDRGAEIPEFPYGPGSPDADRELRSLFASHFSDQEERETKFATEVTSNLVKMNAQLDVLNGSFARQEGLLNALNGSFSRQEGLLAAILDALQTRNSSS